MTKYYKYYIFTKGSWAIGTKRFSVWWSWKWFLDIYYRRQGWQLNLRMPRILTLPGAYEIYIWPLTITIFRNPQAVEASKSLSLKAVRKEK